MNKLIGRHAGPSKIDWVQARNWYFADATRSYSDVAREFGVVKRSVEAQAKKAIDAAGSPTTWAVLRRDLGDQAMAQHDEKLKAQLSARDESHLGMYYDLQALVAKKIATLHKGEVLKDRDGRPCFYPDTHDNAGEPIIVMPAASELDRTAKALIAAVNGERVIRGRPTSVQAMTGKNGEDLQGVGWADLIRAAQEVANGAQSG